MTVPERAIRHRLALIAVLDTEGNIFYSLTQAATDQNVMLAFLVHLVKQLEVERPSFREDTILLLDGASYNKGSKVREYMRKL